LTKKEIIMARHPNVYRPILAVIKRRTDKAILIVITNDDALTDDDATLEVWMPKSQILATKPTQNVRGEDEIMASEWILKEKDLMRFVTATSTASTTPQSKGHPPVPNTPPAKSFVDMDDDIPY
jgi:hypothetical protein